MGLWVYGLVLRADNQGGQPGRTAKADSQGGQPGRTIRADNQGGQPRRTARADNQDGLGGLDGQLGRRAQTAIQSWGSQPQAQ
jgi:hypothetical protein